MKSIILPVAEPYTSTYAIHSDLHSILSVDRRTEAWVISNYIQVEMDRPEYLVGPRAKYDFCHDKRTHGPQCPHVSKDMVSPTIATMFSDIVDFICNSLNKQYYVTVYVDLFFIPRSKSYMKASFNHTIFVYGCDLENRLFYFRGFLTPSGSYQSSVISFDDLMSAYESTTMGGREEYKDISGGYKLVLYKNEFDCRNERPNLKYIKENTEEYLNSKKCVLANSHLVDEETRSANVFGLETYDSILALFEGNRSGLADFSLRSIHCLLQHKILLKRRVILVLDYIGTADQGMLHSVDEVAKLAENIFYIYLEFSLSKSFGKYEELLAKLRTLRDRENDVLHVFLSALSQINAYDTEMI